MGLSFVGLGVRVLGLGKTFMFIIYISCEVLVCLGFMGVTFRLVG